MKQNKSILHLCEVILGVLMLILILNLYLVKLLVDPDISYTPMYRNLCLTLALLVFCMVLALIQRELLARLLHNAYRDVTGIHNKKSLEKKLLELNDRATTFGVGAVSYTHLDVYKRQAERRCRRISLPRKGRTCGHPR